MEEKDQRKDGESFQYLRPAASGCINAGCAAVDDALGVGLGLLTTIIIIFDMHKVNARKEKKKNQKLENIVVESFLSCKCWWTLGKVIECLRYFNLI